MNALHYQKLNNKITIFRTLFKEQLKKLLLKHKKTTIKTYSNDGRYRKIDEL